MPACYSMMIVCLSLVRSCLSAGQPKELPPYEDPEAQLPAALKTLMHLMNALDRAGAHVYDSPLSMLVGYTSRALLRCYDGRGGVARGFSVAQARSELRKSIDVYFDGRASYAKSVGRALPDTWDALRARRA